MEFKKVHPTPEYDVAVLAPFPVIESIKFKKQHLDFEKVEITEKIKNAVILVNHQTFHEIPKPSQVEFRISESIGMEIFGPILKSLRQAEDLMLLMKATPKGVLFVVFKHRWRWKDL
jgi:hypothetical protein